MKSFIKVKREKKQVGRGQNLRNITVVYPDFLTTGKDIMRKGGQFYAILDPETKMWSTNQQDIQRIVDDALYSYADEHFSKDNNGIYHSDDYDEKIVIKTLEEASTKMLIEFNKWFNNLSPNHNYIPLDSDFTFLSDEVTPEMHRSKRLAYDLVDGDISAYEEIVSTLYDEHNREKIEWSIGAVISGDSKKIEKMVVFNGPGGTGKSTILDLIKEMFEGYYGIFVAEELASKSNQFATAAFKDNPLIAIQDDGSLARIDSARLNEFISHKKTMINEKNTKQYSLVPQAMLFVATNDVVDLNDLNLGMPRRLLDVYPTETLIPVGKYRKLVAQMMKFEVPAIAKHCLDVYKKLGKEYYSSYIPSRMIQKTNYMQNFMFDKCDELVKHDPISKTDLMHMFWDYCDLLHLRIKKDGLQFGEEAKLYYENFYKMKWIGSKSARNVYEGFKKDMFMEDYRVTPKEEVKFEGWLKFDSESTDFDDWCKDKGFKAQYPKDNGTPKTYWDEVTTTMDSIDRTKLHYILIPEEEGYIRLDFDIRDNTGEKNLELNIKAANEYPPTYAEISKSGGGVHLYYIYNGDQHDLVRNITKDIEIKTTYGTQPIRRKFIKNNGLAITTLQPGSLPLKERKDMVPVKQVEDEQHLKNLIAKYIRKEGGLSTSQSTSLILKALDEAYDAGFTYDLSEMESDVDQFARHSSNNKDRCMAMVDKMHFKSKDMERLVDTPDEFDGPPGETDENKPIVFFDIEVFPNVFILCWKYAGEKATVTKMINPKPEDVRILFEKFRMVGFNNRDYDNHICWNYFSGATPYMCYDISQKIIVKKDNSAKSWQAYGLSYTDVFDFASNPNKMGLKKWEIKLGIHHQENSYPWDEDLPEDAWDEVADYCANDVIATEAVFNAIQGDYMARLILAKLSGLTPNDKTNKHSMQIIFGDDQNPQSEFVYTDLSKDFPGYKFDAMAKVKSTYKGYEVGEGGFVWAKEGMYRNVKTFDVASMHPSSLIALNLFGCRYTKRFKELKEARLAIKHEDREALKHLLGGELLPFYDEAVKGTDYTLKDLAGALKTVINSIYGLTAAKFENRCRDPRNVDNIVAKRGALFMVDLLEEVQKRGGEVVHIKTDSIKVANPTPELEQFIIDYGKKWGYDFEVESVYDRICLINKAVYIAMEDGEWTATGAEFDHPYIFKKLFSGEPITIDDMSETKNADKGALYLDYNENLPDVTKLEKEREKIIKQWKSGKVPVEMIDGEKSLLTKLENEIAEGHNYKFVGKVSAFLPVKSGVGGGELVVKRDDKYVSASGATGYRWLETEYFKAARKDSDIDMSYYDKLIEGAIADISEFGDFDRFVHDPDYDPQLEKLKDIVNVPDGMDEEVPFDEDTFMNKPVEMKGE